MSKDIKVDLEFIITIEGVGDTEELIKQEINNMLHKIERKWHPINILILHLEVEEDE